MELRNECWLGKLYRSTQEVESGPEEEKKGKEAVREGED